MINTKTTFKQYISNLKTLNLHSKNDSITKYSDISLGNLGHLIIHGPQGIGKYTQSLNIIKQYSNSDLEYEKTVFITTSGKSDYCIKISDIHFEVDMELLGCNAKSLWHDVYNHIIDIVMTSKQKKGIILCKNFHHIHNELLDILYCYINEIHHSVDIHFVLLTDIINYIPRNILDVVDVISLYRPKKREYQKIIGQRSIIGEKLINTHVNAIKSITTINNITYENIANNIYNIIIIDANKQHLSLIDLRDKLYNVLLYHQDIYECFYHIIKRLYGENFIKNTDFININIKLIEFSKLYNNNYRPIFHLERFSLYLNSIVHKYEL